MTSHYTATDRVKASTAVGSTRAGSAAVATSISPIPRGANQHGSPVGLTSVRRRNHKTPPLGMMFDGDPQQLGFFLAQVWTYMQEYGPKIATEGSKMRCITMALEGVCSKVDGHPP